MTPKPYVPCTCGKCDECEHIQLLNDLERAQSEVSSLKEAMSLNNKLHDKAFDIMQEEIVKLKAEVETLQECLDGHK